MDMLEGIVIGMKCPVCDHGVTNGVKRPGGKVFFDCTYCGRADSIREGTVTQETCNLPNWPWWKWGKK